MENRSKVMSWQKNKDDRRKKILTSNSVTICKCHILTCFDVLKAAESKTGD